MSEISDHVWGLSRHADRVWAREACMAPSKASRVNLMVLQAFIDESYDKGGLFVMGGYIAPVGAWAAFSKEWEEMLPYGTRCPKTGEWHFHFREMIVSPERHARIPAFYRIIQNHVSVALSVTLRMEELKKACELVGRPEYTVVWGKISDPHFFCYRALMDCFHDVRSNFDKELPKGERTDFIFDQHSRKKAIIAAWDHYVEAAPDHMKGLFGSCPMFEDDKEYLPLQAADLWAGAIRISTNEKQPFKLHPDGVLQKDRKSIPYYTQHFDFDRICVVLSKLLKHEFSLRT